MRWGDREGELNVVEVNMAELNMAELNIFNGRVEYGEWQRTGGTRSLARWGVSTDL